MLNYQATSQAKSINKGLINTIKEEHRPYLLEVAIKILMNHDEDLDPFTSEERNILDFFSQWKRSIIVTSNPIGMPEWRIVLCSMLGPTPRVQPAGPAPAPPPRGPPMAPSPSSPAVNQNARSRRTNPEPSTRILRSQGPAPFGLLPEKTRSRSSTRRSSQPAPAPGNLDSASTTRNLPDPEALDLRMVNVRMAIARGRRRRASGPPKHQCGSPSAPPEPYRSEDILSFF